MMPQPGPPPAPQPGSPPAQWPAPPSTQWQAPQPPQQPPQAPVRMPRPRPVPPDAVSGGLAFHRLVFARERAGWWTPLVVGVVGLGFYAVLLGIVLALVIVGAILDPGFAERLQATATGLAFDITDPAMLALLLGTIVLMLPAYVCASILINGRGGGFMSSVARRIRWRWLLLCLGIAVALFGILTLISLLIPASLDGAVAPADNPNFALSLVLILVLVPVQSATEEYVFRGYLQQMVGRWLRHPAWAILLPVPLFVLGHTYDLLGQISVGVFAVVAGWLTWRTGGLEAAIALHIVNNLTGFLVAVFGAGEVGGSETDVAGLVISSVVVLAFAGVVEWAFRRSRMTRLLSPSANPALPQAAMPSASKIV